jgi:hypothetical protein
MQIEKTPVRMSRPKAGFHKRTKIGMINATIENLGRIDLNWKPSKKTGSKRKARRRH